MNKLLRIYLAEENSHILLLDEAQTPGGEAAVKSKTNLTRDGAKVQTAIRHAAELIILLTTYIDKHKIDEKGRWELFNQLEDGKWYKE